MSPTWAKAARRARRAGESRRRTWRPASGNARTNRLKITLQWKVCAIVNQRWRIVVDVLCWLQVKRWKRQSRKNRRCSGRPIWNSPQRVDRTCSCTWRRSFSSYCSSLQLYYSIELAKFRIGILRHYRYATANASFLISSKSNIFLFVLFVLG